MASLVRLERRDSCEGGQCPSLRVHEAVASNFCLLPHLLCTSSAPLARRPDQPASIPASLGPYTLDWTECSFSVQRIRAEKLGLIMPSTRCPQNARLSPSHLLTRHCWLSQAQRWCGGNVPANVEQCCPTFRPVFRVRHSHNTHRVRLGRQSLMPLGLARVTLGRRRRKVERSRRPEKSRRPYLWPYGHDDQFCGPSVATTRFVENMHSNGSRTQ